WHGSSQTCPFRWRITFPVRGKSGVAAARSSDSPMIRHWMIRVKRRIVDVGWKLDCTYLVALQSRAYEFIIQLYVGEQIKTESLVSTTSSLLRARAMSASFASVGDGAMGVKKVGRRPKESPVDKRVKPVPEMSENREINLFMLVLQKSISCSQ